MGSATSVVHVEAIFLDRSIIKFDVLPQAEEPTEAVEEAVACLMARAAGYGLQPGSILTMRIDFEATVPPG